VSELSRPPCGRAGGHVGGNIPSFPSTPFLSLRRPPGLYTYYIYLGIATHSPTPTRRRTEEGKALPEAEAFAVRNCGCGRDGVGVGVGVGGSETAFLAAVSCLSCVGSGRV
jgi:hypothetical protein